jgi:hypothetical protein
MQLSANDVKNLYFYALLSIQAEVDPDKDRVASAKRLLRARQTSLNLMGQPFYWWLHSFWLRYLKKSHVRRFLASSIS